MKAFRLFGLFSLFCLPVLAQQNRPLQVAAFSQQKKFTVLPSGNRLYRFAAGDSMQGNCSLVKLYGNCSKLGTGSSLQLRDKEEHLLWSLEWLPANGKDDYICITSTFTDASGNIYASGRFKGLVDLDPGPGVQPGQPAHADASDGFLIRLDEKGNFSWAKTFGGQDNSAAFCDLYCGTILKSGELLFMGSYAWAVDFDPGEYEHIARSGSADPHPFILKLDAAGNFRDIRVIHSSGVSGISSYFIDEEENYFITYYFHDSINVELNCRSAMNFVSINDYYNTCMVKYSSTYDMIWARHFEGDFNRPAITDKTPVLQLQAQSDEQKRFSSRPLSKG